ncbi:MAG: glycosyltransferase family 4 protein [bacterium]
MKTNILYILPSFNKFGGTPKKTLDLISSSPKTCFFYAWSNAYAEEFKEDFIKSGATIYSDDSSKNFLKHVSNLVRIIKKHDIKIVQTQFFYGELLGWLCKLKQPQIKLIVAFVGSLSPNGYRKWFSKLFYKKVDSFVYISSYVKREKEKVFPILKKSKAAIIYNGTNKTPTQSSKNTETDQFTILSVSGLTIIKNISVLVECAAILVEKGYHNFQFLIAGDGPEKENLLRQIAAHNLDKHFKLLGYVKHVGDLYKITNLYAHPCYVEGFGIAVAEAMLEAKPIVASNAGALPELLVEGESGLLVDPFDPEDWANAIMRVIDDHSLAEQLANNAKERALTEFSVASFVNNYHSLYNSLTI